MRKLSIGVITSLDSVLAHGTEEVEALGLDTIQLNAWNPALYTPENAAKVKAALGNKVAISSLWAGWPPPAAWNFYDGPSTLGIVPTAYRAVRVEALKRGADFATLLGITDVTTHCGFIPENPGTTEFREVVIAIREVAQYCKGLGLYFNFETGQETPITLMRTIAEIGLDNLGINLDPANLLLYGKANPCDAVDIFRSYVRGVHVKDGMYPTEGRNLGEEMPVGDGLVNFPVLIRKLLKYDYKGALIIEREISGPQQKTDILRAKELLLAILAEC
jgi:L-ribulose-5-phosphate 3-epimerase